VTELEQAGPFEDLLVHHRSRLLRYLLVFEGKDPAISLVLHSHDFKTVKLKGEHRLLVVVLVSSLQNDSIAQSNNLRHQSWKVWRTGLTAFNHESLVLGLFDEARRFGFVGSSKIRSFVALLIRIWRRLFIRSERFGLKNALERPSQTNPKTLAGLPAWKKSKLLHRLKLLLFQLALVACS
jgi:hypothetical protein